MIYSIFHRFLQSVPRSCERHPDTYHTQLVLPVHCHTLSMSTIPLVYKSFIYLSCIQKLHISMYIYVYKSFIYLCIRTEVASKIMSSKRRTFSSHTFAHNKQSFDVVLLMAIPTTTIVRGASKYINIAAPSTHLWAHVRTFFSKPFKQTKKKNPKIQIPKMMMKSVDKTPRDGFFIPRTN